MAEAVVDWRDLTISLVEPKRLPSPGLPAGSAARKLYPLGVFQLLPCECVFQAHCPWGPDLPADSHGCSERNAHPQEKSRISTIQSGRAKDGYGQIDTNCKEHSVDEGGKRETPLSSPCIGVLYSSTHPHPLPSLNPCIDILAPAVRVGQCDMRRDTDTDTDTAPRDMSSGVIVICDCDRPV